MAKIMIDYDKLQVGDIIYNQNKSKIFFIRDLFFKCKCECKLEGYILYIYHIETHEIDKRRYYLEDFNQSSKKRELIFRIGDENK